MARDKAEDAGGLTPAKDGSAALCHFGRRTLPILKCVDYIQPHPVLSEGRQVLQIALPDQLAAGEIRA